jgi:phosphoribosyl 1,2-cyclic phosphodiesterase
MRIEFYGVRGTCPVAPRRGTVYGGHTPCAVIRTSAGGNLIIDAGTGLRPLEDDLRRGRPGASLALHLLFTHFHFDHISGLPFLRALYAKDSDLRFHSALAPGALRRRLEKFQTEPYFPVEFGATPSRKSFGRIGVRPVSIGGAIVSACALNHPHGCVAFKIEENGRSIVFATDTEHYADGVDARLAAFALGVDVLVYDATFTPAEYASGKIGWGHSTWAAGVELARASGVGRLLLSHLNPDYSDAALGRIEALARRGFPSTACAREGLILRLEK